VELRPLRGATPKALDDSVESSRALFFFDSARFFAKNRFHFFPARSKRRLRWVCLLANLCGRRAHPYGAPPPHPIETDLYVQRRTQIGFAWREGIPPNSLDEGVPEAAPSTTSADTTRP